jgi:hypothetical protein
MLTVGTLGATFIGALQQREQIQAVVKSEAAKEVPGLVKDSELTVADDKKVYEFIEYKAISDAKLEDLLSAEVPTKKDEIANQIKATRDKANQGALALITVFPAFMLVCYLILIVYFKSKGGYQADVLTGHAASDERFTGGVEGPADM